MKDRRKFNFSNTKANLFRRGAPISNRVPMVQPLELSDKSMKRHRDLMQSKHFRAARPPVDIRCEVKYLASGIDPGVPRLKCCVSSTDCLVVITTFDK